MFRFLPAATFSVILWVALIAASRFAYDAFTAFMGSTGGILSLAFF